MEEMLIWEQYTITVNKVSSDGGPVHSGGSCRSSVRQAHGCVVLWQSLLAFFCLFVW